MGNYAEHEAIEDAIYGEAIKSSLDSGILLNHLECTALYNRYHWILENHDRKKSFMVINFDLTIIRFKKVGCLRNDFIWAFSVENPSHFPFIIFPCSNNHFSEALKNIRKYIRSNSNSSRPLLGTTMTMSVITDLDARMNWVFEVIPPPSVYRKYF